MREVLSRVKLLIAGEHGLVVEFGNVISPEINGLVQQLTRQLNSSAITGIIEVVPTYRSATVYFDPLVINRQTLAQIITQLLGDMQPHDQNQLNPRVVRVPVCYGGVFGPDLEFVARYASLSTQEVIALHTSKPYLVYMLGFTPGFPYLGGMSDRIAVPRQEKPRQKIPAGSVGIGGYQTGIYPIESPGEWWLIGRTPLKAFNPQSQNPFLVSAGDYLHFSDITIDEYFKIRRAVDEGTYILEVSAL